MSLALRLRHDPMPALAPLPGLVIRREEDARTMAALQDKPVELMARRFADGHRAYVAWLDGELAAWGWVATRVADIGELGATFALPEGDRYLWNFVTRPSRRGMGIYPRLLAHVVRVESAEAERLWIAYAPENHASGTGIERAGFRRVADLSFDTSGRAAVGGARAGEASRVLGLPVAAGTLAPCWRCVRAGKPADRACREGRCCCDYQRPDIGCAA